MDFKSYVTGFIDGEGCFMVSFTLRSKLKTKIEVRPAFAVAQNKKSLAVLEKMQRFFKCGGIRFDKKDQTYKYEVRSLRDLRRNIIPHFKKYSLLTSKAKDFEKFVTICDSMAKSKHLNAEHLKAIIRLAYTMNSAGKRKHSQEKLLNILNKMKI